MKKNYLKVLAVSALLTPFSTEAQLLTDVQCNINLEYTSVTAAVPNMYTFAYDGLNNINDGGGDMYDGGNVLNTNFNTGIPYVDDVITASTDFGPNGQYFTRELPGFFMLAADLDGVTDFYISGNNGADGSGSAAGYTFSPTVGGTTYDVFFKGVSGAFDPSINHFIIIPSNANASHTFATDTDNDQHNLLGIGGTTRLYYFLVSSDPDVALTNTEIENLATLFLQAINGGASIQANATATEICDGEEVTLTGSGGTGYSWDNGVMDGVAFVPPLGTNIYTVSAVGTNGCNNSASVTVTSAETPDFTLSATDELTGMDGSVYITLNNGQFPFTYDWDNDGTGDFDDPQNLVNVGAGTYTVTVSHGNGCTATDSATVQSFVSINETDLNELEVYPNPTAGELNIQLEGAFNYTLTTLSGKVVSKGNAENQVELSLEDLETGMYIVTVSNELSNYSLQVVKH